MTKRPCTDADLKNPAADCVVQDGQRLVARTVLMDHNPCGCGAPVSDAARNTLATMQHNADRVQAHVDHLTWKDEQRRREIEASPRDSAYDKMRADLHYLPMGGAR